jgi:hypothetical protein
MLFYVVIFFDVPKAIKNNKGVSQGIKGCKMIYDESYSKTVYFIKVKGAVKK